MKTHYRFYYSPDITCWEERKYTFGVLTEAIGKAKELLLKYGRPDESIEIDKIRIPETEDESVGMMLRENWNDCAEITRMGYVTAKGSSVKASSAIWKSDEYLYDM